MQEVIDLLTDSSCLESDENVLIIISSPQQQKQFEYETKKRKPKNETNRSMLIDKKKESFLDDDDWLNKDIGELIMSQGYSFNNKQTETSTSPDKIQSQIKGKKNIETDKLSIEKQIDKELKEKGKELEKERKRLEKEMEKRQKELEKEQLKINKQANKIRDKSTCVSEMILDIDNQLIIENGGIIINALQEVDVVVNPVCNPIPRTITWRRNSSRIWDDTILGWKPCARSIIKESYVLLKLMGPDFEHLSTSSLDSMISSIKLHFPNYKIIILIQGLDKFISQKSKEQRQQFDIAIRQSTNPTNTINPSITSIQKPISKTNINQLLLHLQLDSECFVIHTESIAETATYILSITSEISLLQESERNSCLNLGFGEPIKSGSNHSDTFSKMLQQIFLVSETIALAIMQHYPTLSSLYRAYEKLDPERGGSLIASIQIPLKSGKGSKSVGEVVSKRIYSTFMGTDPNAFAVNN